MPCYGCKAVFKQQLSASTGTVQWSQDHDRDERERLREQCSCLNIILGCRIAAWDAACGSLRHAVLAGRPPAWSSIESSAGAEGVCTALIMVGCGESWGELLDAQHCDRARQIEVPEGNEWRTALLSDFNMAGLISKPHDPQVHNILVNARARTLRAMAPRAHQLQISSRSKWHQLLLLLPRLRRRTAAAGTARKPGSKRPHCGCRCCCGALLSAGSLRERFHILRYIIKAACYHSPCLGMCTVSSSTSRILRISGT